jgi:hypothetical protein
MRKQPISSEEAEELLGGGSLLDRIGRGKAMVKQPTTAKGPQPQQEEEVAHDPMAEKSQAMKVSLYLSPAELDALDAQIIKRRQATGRSPRRTHLIREAIQAWLKQQG